MKVDVIDDGIGIKKEEIPKIFAGSCVWSAGRPDPVLRYSFYRNTLFSRRQIV